jgi:hypothetical protein
MAMIKLYIAISVLQFIIKYQQIVYYITRFGMSYRTAFELANRNGLSTPASHRYFTPRVYEMWDYGELSDCQADHLAIQEIFQPRERESEATSGHSGLYMEQVLAKPFNPVGCSNLDRMFWEDHQMVGTGRYKKFRRLQQTHEVSKPLHHRMEFWADKLNCTLEQGRRFVDAVQGLDLGWKEAWSLKDQIIDDPEFGISYFEVISHELLQLIEEK